MNWSGLLRAMQGVCSEVFDDEVENPFEGRECEKATFLTIDAARFIRKCRFVFEIVLRARVRGALIQGDFWLQ